MWCISLPIISAEEPTNINYLGETVNEEVYFCEDVNSIKWTFEFIKGSDNQFKLKANNGQYLHYEEGQGFSLSGDPTILYADVTPGDNDHVRLCIDEGLHNAVNLYGGKNGFGIWGYGNNDPNELFTLCKPFNMSSSTPGTISTVDNNAEGIELKLFDYDYISTPGTTGELDKDGNKVNNHYNSSVNQGKKFWFLGWGADSNETDPGINDFTGLGSKIRALQGVVQNNLGTDGYPVLAVDQNGYATNDSLNYLFNGRANDTQSYTANHLFEKIGDKYSYDSNKHYAEFNKSTGNFTVYDGTLEQNSGSDKNWAKNDKAVGFFPFDSYSDMKGLYDNDRLYLNPNVSENDQKKSNGQHYRMNHHNGMSLDTHFRLPEGGKDSYGNDIEFEFSGDDDLWVFIDDVLVLDIGGVHQPLNGSINFTTGEVKVDAAIAAKGTSADHIAGTGTTIEEMFRKAGKEYDPNKLHEMKVYWIERGGCDSNCKIEFNLPLTTDKEAGNITFDKVSAVEPSLKLEGAVFTLYKDAECTQPYTIGNVPVTATSDKNGNVNFYAIPPGSYYIKETTFPEGYQAKNPEEIFSVNVEKDTTAKPMKNNEEINNVTNEPKKITVEVEKKWENGTAPQEASVEITLGRYKLAEAPNAQGTGTLVIKDSYTGLPAGNTYSVAYTITGPDNYSNTIHKTYTEGSNNIEISVPDLPAGVAYTVTKSITNVSGYNVTNRTETVSVTVPKKGSADAVLSQSAFSKSAYRVRVYAMNKQNSGNLDLYSDNYYSAGAALSIKLEHNEYNWGFFSFTVLSNTGWTSSTYSSDSQQQFTNSLNQDIELYVRCDTSENWTKAYNWIKDPYITGANPVGTNSANRMLMSARRGGISLTASAPTLPTPPKDTVYEPDTDYANNPDKITLTGNPWTGKAEGLDAYNELGPYVYYIAEINETGMPDGTTVTIEDEVTFDGVTKILTVTNKLPDTGSLKIRKTFDGLNPADLTPAQKESISSITFTITGPGNDSRIIQLSEFIENLEMTIPGLTPGEYTVVEKRPDGSTPSGYRWISTTYSVVNGKTSVNKQETAEVTVTNTYQRLTNITLKKVDIGDLNNDSANLLKGAAFTLTRFTSSSFNEIDPDPKTNFSQTLEDKKNSDGTYSRNGIFTFENVPVGFYKITESVLPAGYVKSGEDPAFEIRKKSGSETELEVILYQKSEQGTYEPVGSGPIALVRVASDNTLIIGNTPGVALPNTGGNGTELFTAIGGILSMTAGAILTLSSCRRRKKQYS